jgi:hypothetical protein
MQLISANAVPQRLLLHGLGLMKCLVRSAPRCFDGSLPCITDSALLFAAAPLAAGTYLPKAINPIHAKEPVNDMATAGLEAKAVMGGAVEDLLAKKGAALLTAT